MVGSILHWLFEFLAARGLLKWEIEDTAGECFETETGVWGRIHPHIVYTSGLVCSAVVVSETFVFEYWRKGRRFVEIVSATRYRRLLTHLRRQVLAHGRVKEMMPGEL